MVVLGYWEVRGIGEPIRLLLHYKNVPFEDKRYSYDGDEWKNDKFNLGLDFPNLPYLIDGDVRMTQSNSILRYLANKHGLEGKTAADRMRVSVAEQQTVDFRWYLIRFVLGDNMENGRAEFLKSATVQLKQWEAFLGHRQYIAGDYITYVDFLLYENFDFYRMFEPGLCKDFPTLRAYHDRIRTLPQLQGYFKGPTFKRWPFYSPKLKWGGGGEEPKHAGDKA